MSRSLLIIVENAQGRASSLLVFSSLCRVSRMLGSSRAFQTLPRHKKKSETISNTPERKTAGFVCEKTNVTFCVGGARKAKERGYKLCFGPICSEHSRNFPTRVFVRVVRRPRSSDVPIRIARSIFYRSPPDQIMLDLAQLPLPLLLRARKRKKRRPGGAEEGQLLMLPRRRPCRKDDGAVWSGVWTTGSSTSRLTAGIPAPVGSLGLLALGRVCVESDAFCSVGRSCSTAPLGGAREDALRFVVWGAVCATAARDDGGEHVFSKVEPSTDHGLLVCRL